MIILEGMDNSGKTTLGTMIKETFGLPIVMGMGKPRSENQAIRWVINALQLASKHPNVVFDRFPMVSDLIYGHALRGGSFVDNHPVLWNTFLAEKPLIIYCRPSDEAILDFGNRPQMEGVIDNAPMLLEAYDQWMIEAPTKFGLSTCMYNWQNPSYGFKSVMRDIAHHINEEALA